MGEPQPSVIGVVGLGSVGEPLLRLLYGAGHDVIGVDTDPDVLTRVGRRMKVAAPEAAGTFALADRLDALSGAGLVVEAVVEDMAVKSELLGALGGLCREDAILATTASALPLMRLAVASGRPSLTLGLRLFLPPFPGAAFQVRTLTLSEEAPVDVLNGVAQSAGLVPVEVGARAGADATALVHAWLNRAVAFLTTGQVIRDGIDTAMRLGCGLPEGPLELADRIGLDTLRASLAELHERTGEERFRPASLLARMVSDGRVGRTSGQGFYAYDDTGERFDTAPVDRTPSLTRPGGGRPVARVGVVGSGTMARGIAEVVAVAGRPTVLVARDRAKAERAREAIEASLTRAVRRGRIGARTKNDALARLRTAAGLDELCDRDLVIEAVVEDLDVKREVFAALGSVCRPGAVLATTTSSLPVGECATASGRPADVIGAHFFHPVPVMRLVELVRAAGTSDDTVATVRAFCGHLGKTTVDSPDTTGFIVNRLLFPYLGDAVGLLDHPDADAAETDGALERGFGYPLGPFRLLDTIGLDVSLAIMRRFHADFSTPDVAPPEVLERLVAQKYLGRKTGRGFRLARVKAGDTLSS